MAEKFSYIPARLKSAVKGGFVTGAEDVKDDALGKNQHEINIDTYRKGETYSKEQLNHMITTPEQEYLSVTATDQTTSLADVAALIATKYPDGKESADTVYRVGCWDGEQYDTGVYTEYVWDGTQYIPIGIKNPGIDEEPTADSNNLVESGGVQEALEKRVQQATVVTDINRDYAYNARINTEAKSIDGSRNRYILNRVSPNHHLFHSDIIDNIWTSSDGSYCSISYFQLSKGETIQLKFKNGASQARKIVRGFWLDEKPVFETTSFSGKMVFEFGLAANDDNYRYLEHTAKEDGYLVIRFVFGTGCDFQASKYEDFSAIQDYVEEELNRMPLIRLRGIDADEDSVSYGDEIDIGDTVSSSTTNGCTDYVDIHEYKYLKLYVTNGTNQTVSTINYGTVYYNSDKEPIKTDSIWQRVNIVSSEYHYSKVPEGAYYIRITQYSQEQRADLVHLAEKICGYKTLKAESKRDIEARVDTLESKYQSDVKTKTVTLVPQTQDTYKYYVNVFNASKPVVYSIKRLSYVPELYTIGGTTLTVKYTGADTKSLRICQYSFIPKGTYITNFTVDKFIKVDSFPNSDSEDFTGTATVTLDKRCKRVLIFITSGTTEEVTVSPFDILDYITEVQLEQEDGYVTAKDEQESDIENIVRQSRFVEDSGNVTANALTLVHCTDIHEDESSINDVLKFHSLGLSEDILCTGDIPVSYPDGTTYHADVIEWLAGTGLMQKSLFVLGNHDGATNTATEEDPVVVHGSAWDGKGQDWDFDNYFADYIDGVGYVMPEGYDDEENEYYKACYWHKDYASQKIRLIGIDCIHRFDGIVDPETGEITSPGLKKLTNEQEVWFIEKLNETLDPENDAYGYSVVVAGHYPLDDFSGDNEEWNDSTHKFIYNQKSTGGRVMSYKNAAPVNFHLETTTSYSAEKGFSMRNRTGSSYTSSFGKGDVNNIAAIITSWMQRDGKFVAYICGHVHRDRMYYSTKYPDILVVACDQAGTLRPSHTGVRNHAYGSGTAFNVITIDTQNGLIKLIREGFDMNQFLNSHKYMCYDYINKKVLNEG